MPIRNRRAADRSRAIRAEAEDTIDTRKAARVGHRRGVALALQAKLVLIDAARNVGGEDELEVDGFGSR